VGPIELDLISVLMRAFDDRDDILASGAVDDVYLRVAMFLVGAEPGAGGTDPQPPR
jgi:hypothetical protein